MASPRSILLPPMTFFEYSSAVASVVVGTAAFCYYFAHLGDGASADLKVALRKAVHSLQFAPTSRHAFAFFVFAADRFFGKKLFSWRAFARSVVLSLTWAVAVSAVFVLIYPNYRSWLTMPLAAHTIAASALGMLVVVAIADFLSVCASRWIVRLAFRHQGAKVVVFALLGDVVASVLIFYLAFESAKTLITAAEFAEPLEAVSLWLKPNQLPILLLTMNELTGNMLRPLPDGSIEIVGGLKVEVVYAFPESVFFWSSLLTSIWLWLYFCSYWTLVLALRLDRLRALALRLFEFEAKPFHAFGLVTVVVCFVIGTLSIALYAVLAFMGVSR
jgi:hypothetical protein